ncbi:MAG: SIS domain-containing protein [Flavobacteriales bacterium]|nr:SIS domain-containing protein [Flavobacteriales bacterium]
MITHQSSLNDFPSQIKYVLKEYKPHGYSSDMFSNIVMGGLGGSGIGSQIAKTWFFDKLNIPVETVSDYNLPHFANEKTLVILNSYSGNTEETLSLFEEAQKKACKIICLASGGKLAELAKEHTLPLYPIETGFQPRMTIGYGLSYLFMILGELAGEEVRAELEKTVEVFENNQEDQIKSAEDLFLYFKSSFKNKFVIVADKYFAPVAIRFCQQLNENSKLEGFVNVLPEANHNVIESYYGKLQTNFIFLYCDLNERVHARFDFLTSHLEMDNNKVLNMLIPEYSIPVIFDVIYRLDWLSIFLGAEHGYDPMQIKNIIELKDYLSNIEYIDESDL